MDDEADLHLATAQSLLEDAEDVRVIEKYTLAVSTSYYAVFHAAKTILAFLGEDTKTHRGTGARFHYCAVRRSDFPAEVAALLGRLQAQRQDADCEAYVEGLWDNSAAVEAIAEAGDFVRETVS